MSDLVRLTGRSYTQEQLAEVAASAHSVRGQPAVWRVGRRYGQCYLIVLGGREVTEVHGGHRRHVDLGGATRRAPHRCHKELAHRLQALAVDVDPATARDLDDAAFTAACAWVIARGQTDQICVDDRGRQRGYRLQRFADQAVRPELAPVLQARGRQPTGARGPPRGRPQPPSRAPAPSESGELGISAEQLLVLTTLLEGWRRGGPWPGMHVLERGTGLSAAKLRPIIDAILPKRVDRA